LSAARKDELGVKLIQALSDVEGLANNQKDTEASSAQFYVFEPEKCREGFRRMPGYCPHLRIGVGWLSTVARADQRADRRLGQGRD